MLSLYLSLLDTQEDKNKLERIYKTYYNLMIKRAFQITQHEYYTELAVSDAVLKITNNIKNIRTDNVDELSSFIYVVVTNSALDALKIKKRDARIVNIEKINETKTNTKYSSNIDSKSNYDFIIKEIHNLPDIYADVLTLRYVHKLSTKNIAKILNRKHGTVRQQLKRGTDTLRKILIRKGAK